jgi:hypothetical protein
MSQTSHIGISAVNDDVAYQDTTLTCPHPDSCPLDGIQADTTGPAFCPLRASGHCVPLAGATAPTRVDRSNEPIGWIDL